MFCKDYCKKNKLKSIGEIVGMAHEEKLQTTGVHWFLSVTIYKIKNLI